jgi:peptidoglycan/xylan/chitin deacetylase (PgdA/CDA1 family)
VGIKRYVKRSVAAAGRLLSRPDPASRRVILTYHSVHPDRPFASTKPSLFREQMEWLKENAQVLSLGDLIDGYGATDGRPAVALTFDDGYEDGHSHALPILKDLDLPATFFITVGFLEKDPLVLQHLASLWRCELDDLVPLSWGQVDDLRSSGMEVGSHSYSHGNLANMSSPEAEHELRGSRDLIGERLGGTVDLFAYPFGKPRIHFSRATVELVKAAGYRAAVAVTFRSIKHSDSPYAIPRFFADGDTTRKIEDKVRGAYDPIGWWQEHAPLKLMAVVSRPEFEK